MLTKLSPSEINAELTQLHGWALEADTRTMCKRWAFDSFKDAMNFLSKVGDLAEQHDHHPEFLACYTKVQIRLTTHDANGLTHKDFELAREIDQLIGHAPSEKP